MVSVRKEPALGPSWLLGLRWKAESRSQGALGHRLPGTLGACGTFPGFSELDGRGCVCCCRWSRRSWTRSGLSSECWRRSSPTDKHTLVKSEESAPEQVPGIEEGRPGRHRYRTKAKATLHPE